MLELLQRRHKTPGELAEEIRAQKAPNLAIMQAAMKELGSETGSEGLPPSVSALIPLLFEKFGVKDADIPGMVDMMAKLGTKFSEIKEQREASDVQV